MHSCVVVIATNGIAGGHEDIQPSHEYGNSGVTKPHVCEYSVS
jgi:hypothetical protein